jgi:Domain of unknown function (DUF4332)/Carboxypeptidase regulatory-like domain
MSYKRHDIAEIEGIGPSRAAALRRLGIRTTEDLLLRSEKHLRVLLRNVPRFPLNRLREFLAHATLMQINGVTGQHAEALYRAGYKRLDHLAAPDPATVARALDAAVAQNLIPESADAKTVMRWQKRALFIAYTGSLAGTVTDGEKPVAGATVICGFEHAETDEGGNFYLPAVPAGKHQVIVKAEGFKRSAHRLTVRPDSAPKYRFKITPGADERPVIDESQGGRITSFRADDTVVFENKTLADLPDGAPLIFRERYKRGGKVRLIGAHRRREGDRIIVPRLVVPASLVEADAAPGDLYYAEGGRLRKGRKSIGALRKGMLLRQLRARGVKANLVSTKEVVR